MKLFVFRSLGFAPLFFFSTLAHSQTAIDSETAARTLSNCLVGMKVISSPNGRVLSEEPTNSVGESDCASLKKTLNFNADTLQANPDIGIEGLKLDALNLQAQNIHLSLIHISEPTRPY